MICACERHLILLWIPALLVLVASCTALPDQVSFNGIDATIVRGADHCGWDDTWLLLVGADDRVVGVEDTNPDLPGEQMFVRDPEAVPEYLYEQPKDLDRVRPADAVLLGDSGSDYELWYSSSDPHYIYVQGSDSEEAWVRAIQWGLCA